MKKLIVLLICLTTLFSVAGCSNKNESIEVDESTNQTGSFIDLGGNIGVTELEGDTYGTYELIETPEEMIYEDTETTLYEDLNCDTPYIVVYRFKKDGYTLEEITKEEAELYSQGYYQMFPARNNVPSGYFCYPYDFNGNYYYTAVQIFEDGEDFVEIEYLGKTEELEIGDTNVYAWVPTGYTSYMDDDYKAHNAYFAVSYSEDYYYPNMFIGKWEYSYDYMKWYYAEDFGDELPFSEEKYVDLAQRTINGEYTMYEFYELLGDTIVYDSYEAGEVFDYSGCYYAVQGGKSEGVEAWFEIDGDWYVAWFESEANPTPAYTDTFLSSLHTK